MTSTNDGKDVKSNPTSSQKGKTYYVELYKNLEAALSTPSLPLPERVKSLCDSWSRVHSLCKHSAPTTQPHLISWVQKHTANTLLSKKWKPTCTDLQNDLEAALSGFIRETEAAIKARSDRSLEWETTLLFWARLFRTLLSDPWGHPVLKKLLNQQGPQPSDKEVIAWLKVERGFMFCARVRQLATSKCEDLALPLTQSIMSRVRGTNDTEGPSASKASALYDCLSVEADFTSEVWEQLSDVELCLLHKMDKSSMCIELAKQTPLQWSYKVVQRLKNRLQNAPHEKKLWKSAHDVATLIAQVSIARCMVAPVLSRSETSVLSHCARALCDLVPAGRLRNQAAALAAPAAAADRLHVLASATKRQCGNDDSMKPFVCELYVRAITAGMNELEKLKLDNQKENETRTHEQSLAQWFVELATILSSSDTMYCECVLTAFSVHPAQQMYELIANAPPLPLLKQQQDETKPSDECVSEFGSWATDSRSQSNLVKTSTTLNMTSKGSGVNVVSTTVITEGERLGLGLELCQDLTVLLAGPRRKTLTWLMPRDQLLENCRSYMECTDGGMRALNTELKYLNLDLTKYQHLPEEDDGEDDDVYYGIEKGYEHLVELEVEKDPLDPERTETADTDEETINKTILKIQNRNKNNLSSDDEVLFSLHAEVQKRVITRKERSHSTMGSKAKHKNHSRESDITTDDVRKDKPKKEKESDKKNKADKKERRRKEKQAVTPLSTLVGKKVTDEASIKKNQKQPDHEKSTSRSLEHGVIISPESGSESGVLFDGLFSMDDLKTSSPDKHPPTPNRTYNPVFPSTPLFGPSTPVANTDSSVQYYNKSYVSHKSPINQRVRQKLTKLIHFRKQPNISSSPDQSRSPISTYSLKSSDSSQSSLNSLDQKPFHNSQSASTTLKPIANNQVSTMPIVPHTDYYNIKYKTDVFPIQQRTPTVIKQGPGVSNKTESVNSDLERIRNMKNFLANFEESLNSERMTNLSPKNLTSTAQHKTSKQGSLQSLLNVKIMSSHTNPSHNLQLSAKQFVSPKKVDNAPHTFARLSYMHKNKQDKNVDRAVQNKPCASQKDAISMEIEKNIAEQQLAKLKTLGQSVTASIRTSVTKSQPSISRMASSNPNLISILNSPLVVATMNNSAVIPQCSSFTEKDPDQYMSVLRQHILLNSTQTVHRNHSNIMSKFPTQDTQNDKPKEVTTINTRQTGESSKPSCQIELKIPVMPHTTNIITSTKSASEKPINSTISQRCTSNIREAILLSEVNTGKRVTNAKAKVAKPNLLNRTCNKGNGQAQQQKTLSNTKPNQERRLQTARNCIESKLDNFISKTLNTMQKQEPYLKVPSVSRTYENTSLSMNERLDMILSETMSKGVEIDYSKTQDWESVMDALRASKTTNVTTLASKHETSVIQSTTAMHTQVKAEVFKQDRKKCTNKSQKNKTVFTHETRGNNIVLKTDKPVSSNADQKPKVQILSVQNIVPPTSAKVPQSSDDYDLLEDLFTDDLRKEIDELSSDEESKKGSNRNFAPTLKHSPEPVNAIKIPVVVSAPSRNTRQMYNIPSSNVITSETCNINKNVVISALPQNVSNVVLMAPRQHIEQYTILRPPVDSGADSTKKYVVNNSPIVAQNAHAAPVISTFVLNNPVADGTNTIEGKPMEILSTPTPKKNVTEHTIVNNLKVRDHPFQPKVNKDHIRETTSLSCIASPMVKQNITEIDNIEEKKIVSKTDYIMKPKESDQKTPGQRNIKDIVNSALPQKILVPILSQEIKSTNEPISKGIDPVLLKEIKDYKENSQVGCRRILLRSSNKISECSTKKDNVTLDHTFKDAKILSASSQSRIISETNVSKVALSEPCEMFDFEEALMGAKILKPTMKVEVSRNERLKLSCEIDKHEENESKSTPVSPLDEMDQDIMKDFQKLKEKIGNIGNKLSPSIDMIESAKHDVNENFTEHEDKPCCSKALTHGNVRTYTDKALVRPRDKQKSHIPKSVIKISDPLIQRNTLMKENKGTGYLKPSLYVPQISSNLKAKEVPLSITKPNILCVKDCGKSVLNKKLTEVSKTKFTSSSKNEATKSNLDEVVNYRQKIQITKTLDIVGPGNLPQKVIKMKLPDGRSYKVTMHGNENVNLDSLFSDETVRKLMGNVWNERKVYKLDVVEGAAKVKVINATELKSETKNETTINLVSDEEEDREKKEGVKTSDLKFEPARSKNFMTASKDPSEQNSKTDEDVSKVSSKEETFKIHQGKLLAKCVVNLVRCDDTLKEISFKRKSASPGLDIYVVETENDNAKSNVEVTKVRNEIEIIEQPCNAKSTEDIEPVTISETSEQCDVRAKCQGSAICETSARNTTVVVKDDSSNDESSKPTPKILQCVPTDDTIIHQTKAKLLDDLRIPLTSDNSAVNVKHEPNSGSLLCSISRVEDSKSILDVSDQDIREIDFVEPGNRVTISDESDDFIEFDLTEAMERTVSPSILCSLPWSTPKDFRSTSRVTSPVMEAFEAIVSLDHKRSISPLNTCSASWLFTKNDMRMSDKNANECRESRQVPRLQSIALKFVQQCDFNTLLHSVNKINKIGSRPLRTLKRRLTALDVVCSKNPKYEVKDDPVQNHKKGIQVPEEITNLLSIDELDNTRLEHELKNTVDDMSIDPEVSHITCEEIQDTGTNIDLKTNDIPVNNETVMLGVNAEVNLDNPSLIPSKPVIRSHDLECHTRIHTKNEKPQMIPCLNNCNSIDESNKPIANISNIPKVTFCSQTFITSSTHEDETCSLPASNGLTEDINMRNNAADDCSRSCTPITNQDEAGITIKGIEVDDPVVGTCYVFRPVGDTTSDSESIRDSESSPCIDFSDCPETLYDVVQIIEELSSDPSTNENTLDTQFMENEPYTVKIAMEASSTLPAPESALVTENVDSTTILKVIPPKRTYKSSLKQKMSIFDVGKPKKYRKGKNIDTPKLTACIIADTTYKKDFTMYTDYVNTLKFSYSRPFLGELVETEKVFENWPITGPISNYGEDRDQSNTCDHSLFVDDASNQNSTDPLRESLVEELGRNYDDIPSSHDDSQTNFFMGFGEGSGRVIQNSKKVELSKFSAATLSDVKHVQPVLQSAIPDVSENLFKGSNNQIEKIRQHIHYINLRHKVRTFFEQTERQLMNENLKNINNTSKLLAQVPGLNNTEYIKPPLLVTAVHVVQVGQLPVSSAQNPVTCDPRVTQVSDASPSQCSVDNSPQSDNNQPNIKAEYTELTTADLSLPLGQNMHDSLDTSNQLSPISAEMDIKGHHLNRDSSKNDQSGNRQSISDSIDYQFDSNANDAITMSSSLESDQLRFCPPSRQNDDIFTHKKENGSSEKTDQIAHAMNAAGITTSQDMTNTSNSRPPQPIVNILSQGVARPVNPVNVAQTSNTFKKTINAMALQQALAQILPPPLNQTSGSDNNPTPQVLHIVQGKNSSGNQITLVDNSQGQSVLTPNAQVLHIVQKQPSSGPASNGTTNAQTNSFGGISLVDAGLQQGGNQLLHIVNTGSQKQGAGGPLLKRVNLLTNLANVQGGNEQKMVQFVCKSADGKSIHLNAPHQRSMVLRLQPIETPNIQSVPKSAGPATSPSQRTNVTPKEATNHEIKSRSMYEENYAKFIQNSSNKPLLSPEKSTSLPKFNQAFGKPIYQDGNQNKNDINSGMMNNSENSECQPTENTINLDHLTHISNPPLLLRKTSVSTSQPQQNIAQQIKQTIAPMNIQTMHGGVIYTRQIPVNIGGGQTINLITVPSTELMTDENGQKQINQGDVEPSIIKIVPQSQNSNTDGNKEESNGNDNVTTPPTQHVMRIKFPMLSKPAPGAPVTRVVRPSFLQIQRNVIGGGNQQVYQQLVLTTAPQLGQQIRLPHVQTARQVKVPTEMQSESQMSSSTLEQLREFDMVLEQVKERSTVQPSGTSSNFSKLLTTSTDTTDSASTKVSTSASETAQQVLYSIGNTQPLNVAYINRKPSVTTTSSIFVRSPDSTGGAADSPSSSSQVPHGSGESSHSDSSQSKSKISSKSIKSRPKPSNTPNTLKVSQIPPKTPTQKPLEDEQTTQRILYILAEYKEQVENSPDKDKPAPRRRSNPPANPSGSSKRKKSSSGSRRPGCTRDHSPIGGEDTSRTMGSEDSSCGTSQGDCNESCSIDAQSPQDSPRKVTRKLSFEPDTPAPTASQTRPVPPRNVIVADGQAIAVARSATGKPATAVLMPANYILPVSMVKGGQQIAIVTNRGPKLLTVGGTGEGGAANTLLLQRLIGPAGLKPMLARTGVRHVRLPAAALQNLHGFNLTTATTTTSSTPGSGAQPVDSTASSASNPPELVETRTSGASWTDRDSSEVKPDRSASPDASDWPMQPASESQHTYTYPGRGASQSENVDRTVLDTIPGRYSPDIEAQRIFDKMFNVGTKKSFVPDRNESPREAHAFDLEGSDGEERHYPQVVQKRDGTTHSLQRVTHISAAALRHKYAMLEHELRLQKSLSEECEDLGVDSPSASDLFPEAELLFAASPAAHDHAHEHTHTNTHTTPQSTISQPDLDDQIASDAILPPLKSEVQPDLDVNLTGLEDVGIVTVSEGGLQTITLNQEEFARAHPNTTFHSEPSDACGEVQPFQISSGLKGRAITSIFHGGSGPATVLMSGPTSAAAVRQQPAVATAIAIATASAAPATVTTTPTVSAANDTKFPDLEAIINNIPTTHHSVNVNISSMLSKDEGLSRFDSVLTDRESRLSSTTTTTTHGNAAKVIKRVCYDARKRNKFSVTETTANVLPGADAKMATTEKKSRQEDTLADADDDRSTPERHAALFWESNFVDRESRRHMDFSSDSEKSCKSPLFDETNSTDSFGAGAQLRLDSVIKEARVRKNSGGSVGGSSAEEVTLPPVRTYPAKRTYPHESAHGERSTTGKTRAGEARRRASVRGVVARGCHCCNTSPQPQPSKPKKPRQRKPTLDFNN